VTNQRTFSVTLAAAAMVGWWLAPVPEATPALVKPRQDGWRLPALPRAVDQSTVAAVVAGAPYWGRAAAAPVAQATAPVDPRWRIAAVYGVGADRGALIQFAQADRPPQRECALATSFPADIQSSRSTIARSASALAARPIA
jgi:hypothetical protein